MQFERVRMAPTVLVENPIEENRELAGILGASISTAQAKALPNP
jgi:hypothetical protein